MMRVYAFMALMLGAASIAGCESLPNPLDRSSAPVADPVDVPVATQDDVTEPEPATDILDPEITGEEPEGAAEPELAANPGDGVIGAAVCISAAYYLADAELLSEEEATAYAEVWAGILDVIPADVEERQNAVNDAYAAFFALDQQGDQDGTAGALAQYDDGGQCGDPDVQRAFLLRYGDPDLMDFRLQETE